MDGEKRQLSLVQQEEILGTLESRFARNQGWYVDLSWEPIRARLEKFPEKIWSLYEMERTGGEPALVGYDKKTDTYIFVDCSAETPAGRRNLCYDNEAMEARKRNKPANSALGMADSMGISLLTEKWYRKLQKLGIFDTRTSSWVLTPGSVRKRGGALFCDRRYDKVFLYHNGAESYFADRGFRGILKV